MRATITFNDIEEYISCPRKYFLQPPEEELFKSFEQNTRNLLNLNFSVENPVISINFHEKTLISDPDLIIPDKNGWKIVLKKTAKNFKEKYLLEAAFHGYVFSNAGFPVTEVIVTSEFFTQKIDWKNSLPLLFSTLEQMAKIQPTEPPQPKPCELCKNCQYVFDCTKDLIQKQDLLAIHGISDKTKEKLAKCGIFSLSDLLNFKEKCSKHFDEKLVKKALSLLQEKPIILTPYKKLEPGVFVDIEFNSLKHFDFLFGILQDDKYTPYLCKDENEEKEVFKELLDLFLKLNCPIYHYGPYEPKRFQQLAYKYKEFLPMYERVKKNFFDLYQFLCKHVALPLFTYSLKSVARYFGFTATTQLDSSKANRYFQRWLLTKDDHYLSVLLKYNEEDLRSTKLVFERLNFLVDQDVTSQQP
ncbi:TM0106 family RecB-like putative nuclease [Pseudothermotoga thermarum]|uniref:RecB family nuclease, putative n=1 Tax=Pseudothermotoga thermarum DSM 5069 TaxID=688269 RepID=F7YWV3_9THEM|nr:TM0106 family RecB-like putative nuclease [Pseudothermotoga thermarum]AEH50474.1 RecB family nuclease, putative [Pseudothermotoga thermarum DSM 5069]